LGKTRTLQTAPEFRRRGAAPANSVGLRPALLRNQRLSTGVRTRSPPSPGPACPFLYRSTLNFLSADVRNLFGPFINVFLVTGQHWTQTEVGLVTTVSGLIGIALQTPIGAVIDVTRAKRAVIVTTMAAMSVAAIVIVIRPTFWPMLFATGLLAVAGDAFAPAVSAVTLGLVPRDALARRLGRNSAFDHGGNIATALVAGLVGYVLSQRAVFLLVHFFAVLTSAAVLTIPARAIDHDRARDLSKDGEGDRAAASYMTLFRTPALVVFAVSALFFHFANAPLLPLVGQKLALQFPEEATAMMSFCMVAAQGVMVPIALVVGWRADRWGRRPIFLIAFSVLPIRAALYPMSDNVFWLLGVQLLDGVGAGIYQALTPLVIADIMRGSGRYNLAQGAVATTQGIGAAISGLFAGAVADRFGYSTAFFGLAAAAAVAWAVFFLLMPETRNDGRHARNGEASTAEGPTRVR
jgi:MFS family permease